MVAEALPYDGRPRSSGKLKPTTFETLTRVPKEEEIEQVTLLARVMYKAVLGLHYKRKEQKKSGQLAIFYSALQRE